MVEAMCTKISLALYQFLSFHSIHCVSTKFPTILDGLTVSGELQKGWEAEGLEGGQDGVQKLKRKA